MSMIEDETGEQVVYSLAEPGLLPRHPRLPSGNPMTIEALRENFPGIIHSRYLDPDPAMSSAFASLNQHFRVKFEPLAPRSKVKQQVLR